MATFLLRLKYFIHGCNFRYVFLCWAQVLCLFLCVGLTNAFCIYSNSKMISIELKFDLINPSVSIFIESQLLKYKVHVHSFRVIVKHKILFEFARRIIKKPNQFGLGFKMLKYQNQKECGSYVLCFMFVLTFNTFQIPNIRWLWVITDSRSLFSYFC